MVIQYIMTDIFWSSSHTLQHALPTSHGLKRCLQNQGAAREHHHRDAYPGLCWMALGNGNGALCLTQSWEVLVHHGSLWYQYINMYPYQSYFGPDHHLINGPILKIHSAKPWSKSMPREEGYATSTPTTASLPQPKGRKARQQMYTSRFVQHATPYSQSFSSSTSTASMVLMAGLTCKPNSHMTCPGYFRNLQDV